MKKELAYRILNKKTGNYISANKKSFWKSLNWVISKLVDISKNRTYDSQPNDLKNDLLEVQVYEWVLVEKYSAKDLFENHINTIKEKNENEKLLKLKKDVIEKRIKDLVPETNINDILSLHRKKLLNNEVMKKLNILIKSYKAL